MDASDELAALFDNVGLYSDLLGKIQTAKRG